MESCFQFTDWRYKPARPVQIEGEDLFKGKVYFGINIRGVFWPGINMHFKEIRRQHQLKKNLGINIFLKNFRVSTIFPVEILKKKTTLGISMVSTSQL